MQRRVVTLNVSDNYFKTPDSDYLLVTNNKMSRPAYEAWKTLMGDKLQTSIDIWDISYKNFIYFIEKLGEYDERSKVESGYDDFRTSLAEDFRGKTIILLANEFAASGNDEANKTIWDYINMRDLRAACAIYDINLYVIGDQNKSRIKDMYAPRQVEGMTVEYSTFDELYDMVDDGKELVMREANRDAPYWESSMRSTLTSWRFFTKPGRNLIKRRAKSLVNNALTTNPDADFVTVHRFDASRINAVKVFGKEFKFSIFGKEIRPFGSHWEVGDVELWRSVAPEVGNIILQHSTNWDAIGSNYVNSPENLLNLFLSRSFEENLKDFEKYLSRYDKLTESQKDIVPVLIKAIEKMLVLEQVSLRYRLSFMPSSKRKLSLRLPYLKSLAALNMKLEQSLPVEIVESVGDMLMNVMEYSKGQRKWWERFILLNRTKNAKITRLSAPLIEEVLKNMYSDRMTKPDLKAHFKSLLKRKVDYLKSIRKEAETWKSLTLRFIDIAELVDRIPQYRGVMAGDAFDKDQLRLENRDVKIDNASNRAVEERNELKTDNPMLSAEYIQAQRAKRLSLSCNALLN